MVPKRIKPSKKGGKELFASRRDDRLKRKTAKVPLPQTYTLVRAAKNKVFGFVEELQSKYPFNYWEKRLHDDYIKPRLEQEKATTTFILSYFINVLVEGSAEKRAFKRLVRSSTKKLFYELENDFSGFPLPAKLSATEKKNLELVDFKTFVRVRQELEAFESHISEDIRHRNSTQIHTIAWSLSHSASLINILFDEKGKIRKKG